MRALIALEDGRCFEGESFGATGTCVGEICFNTSMTGYQEVLTDPVQAGVMAVMAVAETASFSLERLSRRIF